MLQPISDKAYAEVAKRVDYLVHSDPLTVLASEDKLLLWQVMISPCVVERFNATSFTKPYCGVNITFMVVLQVRHHLIQDPQALPKFLLALDWTIMSQVNEACRLLGEFGFVTSIITNAMLVSAVNPNHLHPMSNCAVFHASDLWKPPPFPIQAVELLGPRFAHFRVRECMIIILNLYLDDALR